MNSLKFILLSFCLWLAGFVYGQAQNNWRQTNPLPGNDTYCFLRMQQNGQKGVSLGNGFSCILTQDSGNSWVNRQISPKRLGYSSATFLNDSIGYITTLDNNFGGLYKTENGGKDWFKIDSLTDFTKIKYGKGVLFACRFNAFVRSIDKGVSWQVMSPNTIVPFEFFEIQNKDTLWSKSGKRLLRSTNGGNTWQVSGPQFPRKIIHVHAFNNKQLYLTGDSGLYAYSFNGGLSWTTQMNPGSDPGEAEALPSVQFSDARHGWISGYGYTTGLDTYYYATADSGRTWQKRGKSFRFAQTFHFIDSIHGWIGGAGGYLAKTVDGGQNWTLLTKGSLPIPKMFQTGIRVSERQTADRIWVKGSDYIAFSENRGKDWVTQNLDSVNSDGALKFVNSNLGFSASINTIYRTTNGGQTWHSTPVGFTVTQFFFVNSLVGWAVGYFKVLKTTDGGQTWFQSGPSYSADTANGFIHFFSEQKGIKLIRNGGGNNWFKVMQTNDGGLSYDTVRLSQTGLWPYDMHFFNDQLGFISAGNKIFRTTNAGKTWTGINAFDGLFNLKFVSASEGYALNFYEGMFRTTNAGNTWQSIESPVTRGSLGLTSFLLEDGKPVICTGVENSVYVRDGWSDAGKTVVKGRIVTKVNNDCIQDPNELPFTRNLVQIDPGPQYGSTGPDGIFAMAVDSGSYSVKQIFNTLIALNLEKQFCPPNNQSIPIEVNGFQDSLENNNFINDVKSCAILNLTVSMERLRPCLQSTATIQVQNVGNVQSDSEYVYIRLPHYLSFVSASAPFSFIPADSTYRFRIQPLITGESTVITIWQTVACLPALLMGQTLCVKATIPNAPACLLQSPNWDGADLEVASRCQNGQTRFTLHNKGAAMGTTSQYKIFIGSALVYQAPFQLAANGSMTVSIPANAPAGFVRMVVPQSAHHPLSTFASAEANCATGLSTNGIFPPPDQSPLVDIECVTVTNAYDPNDKQVFPTGWGADGNVEPGTEFKYTVRFQNTGTDTAFKVVLIDTLDQDLDIASLQIGNGSHPFQFNVSGKGRPVLTWTFNNILLPDSNTNQEASNGFVNFSIRPKAGLALGTRLENFADIYFDFNDPIRTNTTVNTLWEPTYTPGVLDTVFLTEVKKSLVVKDISIYPNPTKGKLEVNVPEAGVLQVYNTKGEAVLTTQLEVGKQSLNFSQLPKGLYLIQFRSPEGQICKKVILE